MAPNNTTSHENTTKNITNRRWIHKSDPLINNKNFRYSEKYSCNFQQNLEELKSSGFYYTNISRGEAEEMLTGYNPGSFLLRDSSSAESFFAVTFVTQSMVKKSVKILYSMESFQFQSNLTEPLRSDTVLGLIQKQIQRQLERQTTLLLLNPLKRGVQSLKHICRLNVNRREDFLVKCKNGHVKQYLCLYTYKL